MRIAVDGVEMNMPGERGGTTPLEREILTHYWTSPKPYRDGTENWNPLIWQIVEDFVQDGLLICHYGNDGLIRVSANSDALGPYMKALAAVPLPVQKWVVPGEKA